MSKPKILFLHISKTGGGTIKNVIKKNKLTGYITSRHFIEDATPLPKTVPQRHIIISVRDPIPRFVSSFNWRGVNAWKSCSQKEKHFFKFFSTPNELAEGLSLNSKKALKATQTIRHIQQNFSINYYTGGIETIKHLLSKDTNFYLIHTDTLLDDAQRVLTTVMKKAYGKNVKINGGDEDIKNVSTKKKNSQNISELGKENLRKLYVKDYETLEFLESISK